MTHFGEYPLVFPFSIWPGQGFNVEVFCLMHFPLSSNQNGKGCFTDVSSEKVTQLAAALLHNFRDL